MKTISTLLLLLVVFTVSAQKKKIDPSCYNEWKSLSSTVISDDGDFISYQIDPFKGDGYLYIYRVKSGRLDSIPRAADAEFSGGSRFIAFRIKPGYDTLRKCELDKVDKKKWPKDTLGIYLLDKDSLIKIPHLKSFELSEEQDWLVYQLDHNKEKEDATEKKKKKKKKDDKKDYKSDGTLVYLFHPDKSSWCSRDVSSYTLSENGKYLSIVTHRKYKCDSVHLSVLSTADLSKWTSHETYTEIRKLKINEDESKLAYLHSLDSSKTKVFSLTVLNLSDFSTFRTIDTTTAGIIKGEAVSDNFDPLFTVSGDYLFFGVAKKPEPEAKDTLLESEKVNLDIWSYMDYRLQPQQNIELKRDLKKTDRYVLDLNNGAMTLLCGDSLKLDLSETFNGKYLMGRSDLRFAEEYNYEMPKKADYYRLSVKTGEAELLRDGTRFGISLAPSGLSYVYYGDQDQQFHFVDPKKHDHCITCGVKDVVWTEDINGMPMQAPPFGVIGWDRSETRIYLQSEYDVWEYNSTDNSLAPLGFGVGADEHIKIRPEVWSHDSVYVDFDNTWFKGFDERTKGTHLYQYESHIDHWDLKELAYYDADLMEFSRSKNKKASTFRIMTLKDYPEVFLFHQDPEVMKRISVTNPQQKEYNWANVELIKWKTYQGLELEGLLYTPEDFDSTKQYPLMVYYYELYSDRFHRYYSPKPTASIIYPTEYASAGYVVFIPDIRYIPGHPAKSAYDCIMSGTDAVLKYLPNVDSTRMALQGQSWGGYQTAQMVTMTTRYKAAMAGAPVANMFSAYGGIRWGSGMNRQFQYERTQSRIGATIWERPDLYIENSPLFHLPNVETPLLIMHNDNDDAVPWYQGIELFTGLTRLRKEVWLLNYNDDKHNLMKDANRMDLSIRMRQFFDYYLLDQPAPRWMIEGRPATVKEEEMRYELIEEVGDR